MAASTFPHYHIELLDKHWDFHLLLGIQMMFSFMLVDNEQPLRVCKHCRRYFWASQNMDFCSARCKEQSDTRKNRKERD